MTGSRMVPTLRQVVYVLVIVVVPNVLLRGAFSQELLKVTVLVLLVGLLVALRLYESVRVGGVLRGPRPLTWVTVGLVLALLVSSVLSPQPWAAFTGVTGRGGGVRSWRAPPPLRH